MSFQLFKNNPSDPPRRPVSFDDLDNKAFWCAHGEAQEAAFVRVMAQISSAWDISIHPAKQHNPFHPDLLCIDRATGDEIVGEVKIKNSPLFIADEKYGVPSQYALTMDLKDSFNYTESLNRGVDILIFLWVKWEVHEMVWRYRERESRYQVNPMKGVWCIPFSRLRQFEVASPPPIHWYRESFRRAPLIDGDSAESAMLLNFDARLKRRNNQVKAISSKGFINRDGRRFPAGHSSCSYVFNLRDADLFGQIIFWEGQHPGSAEISG